MHWLDALNKYKKDNQSCVLVVIISVDGSAPRPVGTRMLVGSGDCYDTLGGGALELEAISHARALLASDDQSNTISTRTVLLGADLSQCCGGRVTLLFDCHRKNHFRLHLFGAGHVAQEIARIALRLPLVIDIHDSRSDWLLRLRQALRTGQDSRQMGTEPLPGSSAETSLSTHILDADVYSAVQSFPAGGFYLVMTHSHETDFEVVEAILSRGDAAYCGLIASRSKAAKFRQRLTRKGFTAAELSGLTAPLGENVQTGNTPMEVAIAAMSDVLTTRQHLLKQFTGAVSERCY
ncbi:MAG: xanthine dehydrogenase accessory protein XdhC [Granulosicoccus sp.]